MIFNDRHAFGTVAVALHWLIAVLIFGQFGVGFIMTAWLDALPEAQFWAYQWHKSLGLLTLALVMLRLAWFALNARPAPLSLSPAERCAARLVQSWLLLGPLAVALAGWATASASPLGIPTLAFNLFLVPHLPLQAGEAQEAFWSNLHRILAWLTVIAAAGHATAALHHHLVRGDDTLRRMLSFRRSSTAE